ncbi:MAG: Ig-like domain-containing protein [Saprospiraceae bacterium]|nr:Ig-like domain-containing protein [Saprospiraceae bacterium]
MYWRNNSIVSSSGSTWASSNNLIATVSNSGLVTGVATGSATFTFTLTGGCTSLPTEPISVNPAPTASISGPTIVCIGGTTTLSPSTGGTWSSSNPSVATVTNTGIVTGIAPGTVNFTFVETASGCASTAATPDLTITQCFNPDFNATFL